MITVTNEDSAIVIRIPHETVQHAVENNEDLEIEDDDGEVTPPQITDLKVFADEIVATLTQEAGDGTTMVHTFLDQAILEALENGAEGIETD